MTTLIFYPEDKQYISKKKLMQELTKLKIENTEAIINNRVCIAITFDWKQWHALSDEAKEMIIFIFEFNCDFND